MDGATARRSHKRHYVKSRKGPRQSAADAAAAVIPGGFTTARPVVRLRRATGHAGSLERQEHVQLAAPSRPRPNSRVTRGHLGSVDRESGVHVEFEAAVRVHMLPDHHNQTVYVLKCRTCGAEYGANGADIWLRRCPKHDGGAAGLSF